MFCVDLTWCAMVVFLEAGWWWNHHQELQHGRMNKIKMCGQKVFWKKLSCVMVWIMLKMVDTCPHVCTALSTLVPAWYFHGNTKYSTHFGLWSISLKCVLFAFVYMILLIACLFISLIQGYNQPKEYIACQGKFLCSAACAELMNLMTAVNFLNQQN